MKFKRVDLKQEKQVHFAEHEILLSFYDDLGAEAFQEWWNEVGSESFAEWIKRNSKYDDLTCYLEPHARW
jgi:hypothetical protein